MNGSKREQAASDHGPRYASALATLREEGVIGSGGRLPVTREDVQDLLADGYSKAQVARALRISKATVNRRLKEKPPRRPLTFPRLEG